MTDPKRPEDLPRLSDEERAELDSGYVAIEGVPESGEPGHTEGPWVANGVSVYAQPHVRETTFKDEDGNECPFTEGLVALVYSCGARNNMEANARLIAAAPALLAALKRARDNGLADTADVILVRAAMDAAINAAEGRS